MRIGTTYWHINLEQFITYSVTRIFTNQFYVVVGFTLYLMYFLKVYLLILCASRGRIHLCRDQA